MCTHMKLVMWIILPLIYGKLNFKDPFNMQYTHNNQ